MYTPVHQHSLHSDWNLVHGFLGATGLGKNGVKSANVLIERLAGKFQGSGRLTGFHVCHLSREKHEIPGRAQESAH